MLTIYDKLRTMLNSGKSLDVKFIHVGSGTELFKYCKQNKLSYIGFGTENFLKECNELKDNDKKENAELKIREFLETESRKKKPDKNPKIGSPVRQIKDFFEDYGETLWITTSDKTLYFNFSKDKPAEIRTLSIKGEEKESFTLREMEFDWTNLDSEKTSLKLSLLNGGIKKTVSYQGTICKFQNHETADKRNYAKLLVKRILNEKNEKIDAAKKALEEIQSALQSMIVDYEEKDFELLIELIISRAGFKRIGVAGKNEEFTDLEIQHPISGETYVVQVKSEADNDLYKGYIKKHQNYRINNQSCKMIFAYHTGKIDESIRLNPGQEVIIWDVVEIAKLALINGLAEWIIETAPV